MGSFSSIFLNCPEHAFFSGEESSPYYFIEAGVHLQNFELTLEPLPEEVLPYRPHPLLLPLGKTSESLEHSSLLEYLNLPPDKGSLLVLDLFNLLLF